MNAYRIAPGAGLPGLERLTEPTRPLAADEVRVRMRAVSLNFRDLMIAHGSYPLAPDARPIPGSDGAGEVIEVGAGVRSFAPGDKVVSVFYPDWAGGVRPPASIATALGGNVDGVLAREAVLPARALLPMPTGYDFAEAATLPVAAVTAWSALFEAGAARPGDTALLLGTGGVSIWGLQIAKAAGLRTVITSSSNEKLVRARSLGADITVNYREQPEWQHEVLRLTEGRGADVTLEVGGGGTLQRSVEATAVGGTVALIGVLTGVNAGFNPFPLLFGARRLAGILVGSRDDQAQLQRFLAATGIRPVIDRVFAFEALPEAYAYLQSGQHFGKVVVSL